MPAKRPSYYSNPVPVFEPEKEKGDDSYKNYILIGCIVSGVSGYTLGGTFGGILIFVSVILAILYLVTFFSKELTEWYNNLQNRF